MATERDAGQTTVYELPSFTKRFGALLIDWILCVLVSNIFGDPTQDGWPPVVVLIFEYTVFIGLFARTPGMALARMRCISFADGRGIGIFRAFLRGVLLCLVVPALIMDSHRRGLHDRAAGSIMIEASPKSS